MPKHKRWAPWRKTYTNPGDVEVLLGVLGELLEEECQQGVDVLAGGCGVADRASAVRVANVDGLIEEDDGGVGVP
jgi:hypothetical protein